MSYKNDTKGFVNMIKNGWLHTPKESIENVYNIINKMILCKQTVSEIFPIFHAKEVQLFLNLILNDGVELKVLNNKVCSDVKIIVNIDYDSLSSGEYYNLKKYIKKLKTN